MAQKVEEFFHDFRQELLAGAEANGLFQLDEFMETVAVELVDTGFTEGFELCHYRAQRGMRVDGFWFNDQGEIVNILLKIKNSFLPTKQILIGL
ncbi:hypothetical protein [Aeromonas caviae]|uniref:hypothetical protein n=1 Tax=Aeromonas caviae TaxID=648 RepID=UPI0038D1DBFA